MPQPGHYLDGQAKVRPRLKVQDTLVLKYTSPMLGSPEVAHSHLGLSPVDSVGALLAKRFNVLEPPIILPKRKTVETVGFFGSGSCHWAESRGVNKNLGSQPALVQAGGDILSSTLFLLRPLGHLSKLSRHWWDAIHA